MSQEKFSGGVVSKFKRKLGVVSLVATSLLHPETASSQNKSAQNIELSEQQRIEKYKQWLVDISVDDPRLVGATLVEDSSPKVSLGDGKVFKISLKGGGSLVIKDGAFSLRNFEEAINTGLAKLEYEKSVKSEITEEMAQQWLKDLASSEPELKGAYVWIDHKAEGINVGFGTIGAYRFTFPDGSTWGMNIPRENNNQKEFNRRMKTHLQDVRRNKE